jgi:hypothetical protein
MNRALDIREALLESEGRLSGRIPVEDEADDTSSDILSRIDSHFSEDHQSAEAASPASSSGQGT